MRSGAVTGKPRVASGYDPANAPVGAASGVNVFGLAQRSLRFIVITHGQASDPVWRWYRTALKQPAATWASL